MPPPRIAPAKPAKRYVTSSGFSAWVLVNDRPVEVYAVTEDNGRHKLTCFIESQEGCEFCVGFRVDQDGQTRELCPDVAVDLFVDGVHSSADRQLFQPSQFPVRSVERSYTWRGRLDSTKSLRPFLFAKLALTDDSDLACEDEHIVQSLGTIRLTVCRGTVGEASADDPRFDGQEAPPVLHENMKKASLSHQAVLGPSRPYGAPLRSTFDWEDDFEEPYLEFEFQYRSRALLEIKDIVPPRPPAASATPPLPPPPAPRARAAKHSLSSSATPEVIAESLEAEVVRLRAENARLRTLKADGDLEPEVKRLRSELERLKQERGKEGKKAKLEVQTPQKVMLEVKGKGKASTSRKGKEKEREKEMEVLVLEDDEDD